MEQVERYAGWQQAAFWFSWLTLGFPVYAAGFGTWLVGSLLPGYHEPVDVVLALVFMVTLIALLAVALYALWHYLHQSRSYTRVMSWVLAGLLLIPLLSSSLALTAYVHFNDIAIPFPKFQAG